MKTGDKQADEFVKRIERFIGLDIRVAVALNAVLFVICLTAYAVGIDGVATRGSNFLVWGLLSLPSLSVFWRAEK
jgi:hypothetical protein